MWLCLLGICSAAGFNLEQTGSIGSENLFFGEGTTLAADASGTLFVLDPDAFQVRVFNDDLQEVRAFGRKGKGPGEFEEPKGIVSTPDGSLAVFDPSLKRITYFDPSGAVLHTDRMDVSSVAVYHPVVLRERRTAFLAARAQGGKPVYDLSIFDQGGKQSHNLVRIPVTPLDWTRSSEPSFWVDFLVNELELINAGLPVMCALNGDTLVYARSNSYQLFIHAVDGSQKRVVTRQVKPRALTEAAKLAAYEAVWNRLTTDPFLSNNMPQAVFERAVAKAEAPQALPMVTALTPLGRGFAALVNYDRLKRRGQLDLFDHDGNYSGSTAYEGGANFLTGRGDVLYSVGPNQHDIVSITRYHLR